MQATPQTDTVSPVTLAEAAAFAGIDPADVLLPGMLQAATDAVIRYLNIDLLERDWIGIVPAQSAARAQLSPALYPWPSFELPYTGLVSVNSVTVNDGQALDYTVEQYRRPARITVHGWDRLSELQIEYTAGMATIPAAIKSAIMLMTAYMYDHRGECDGDMALKKSGAMDQLRPHRVEVSL